MIDDVQVSFPRYDLRATGNFSRALDLHLLFASKVFAVEGRFMGSPRWNAPSTRGDRRCGANVETVNHSSLNARRRSPVNASTRNVSHRGVEANFARCSRVVRLSSAATETVAATRPLASGIKWDFTGARSAATLRRIPAMKEEAT